MISKEVDLIKKDNLAKGKITHLIRLWAMFNDSDDEKFWDIETKELASDIKENDPPEYWGNISGCVTNFITNTYKYPWMATKISKKVSSFEF